MSGGWGGDGPAKEPPGPGDASPVESRARINALSLLKLSLVLAPWAFIAYLLRDLNEAVDAFRDASIAPIAGALVLMVAVLVLMAAIWVRLVHHLARQQGEPDGAVLLRSFARSWLARYLPGKLWVYGARVVHTDREMVPRRILASSLVVEITLILGSASVLGLGLWTWSAVSLPAGAAILVAGSALLIATLPRLDRLFQVALGVSGRVLPARWRSLGEDLERAADDPGLGLKASVLLTKGYLAMNLVGGLAFVLVVFSLGDVSSSDLPLLVGAFCLSGVLGILAVFAPAGLGVREAALAGLIAPAVGGPVAASAAILMRLLVLAADAVFVGGVEVAGLFGRPRRSLAREPEIRR